MLSNNKTNIKLLTDPECKKLLDHVNSELSKTYKRNKENSLYITINPDGNKKLKSSNSNRYFIWNIPAVNTCPFRTKKCEKYCYALKAERQYKNCKAARQNNFNISLQDDFIVRMVFTILTEKQTPKFRNKRMTVRIHESGDYYNQEYANKWLNIVHIIEMTGLDIVFDSYTKSIGYFPPAKTLYEYFPSYKFKTSVWDDTDTAVLPLLMSYRFYTAINGNEFDGFISDHPDYKECKCSGCGSECTYCTDNSVKAMLVRIH